MRIGQQIEIGEPATLVLDSVPGRLAQNEMRFLMYVGVKAIISSLVPNADPRPSPDMHLKRREEQFSER